MVYCPLSKLTIALGGLILVPSLAPAAVSKRAASQPVQALDYE